MAMESLSNIFDKKDISTGGLCIARYWVLGALWNIFDKKDISVGLLRIASCWALGLLDIINQLISIR